MGKSVHYFIFILDDWLLCHMKTSETGFHYIYEEVSVY